MAVFISPHGFGHASRASAVMEALLHLDSQIHFEIYSQTPDWFFDSLPAGSYSMHSAPTDIGLVQKTPLVEDIPATLERLESFTAALPSQAGYFGNELKIQGCQLVLCDISPLGILAAAQAGIPSCLVENFTWDWIYSAYLTDFPQFSSYIDLFKNIFDHVDLHIQTEPVCNRQPSLLLCSPASRKPKLSPGEVRSHLGVPEGRKTCLVSLGSLLDQYQVTGVAMRKVDWTFLIPDASNCVKHMRNLVLLPQHYEISHPELVAASDVLIAKAGYSTIAEAYTSGTPFGYLNRPQFPESACLEEFLQREMPASHINDEEMRTGSWVRRLEELYALPRRMHPHVNGADEIARLIYNYLGQSSA